MSTEQSPQPVRREGMGFYPILFFGFGIAAGILVAFSGIGYLEDSAALIATVFLSAVMVVMLIGIILFAARRKIWERVFGVAEVQIDQLATPLANVADRAIARDPAGATSAARDLASLALARYSWITARRWIITSLTALIASMATLAGTALLFKQNQLIAIQSDLLREQNSKAQEQTGLIQQQVQLAEADRNSQVAARITEIAVELGAVVDQAEKDYKAATGQPMPGLFNAIKIEDLSRSLIFRITSTSQSAKPYRFLNLGLRANSLKDLTRIAAQRRRTELPNTYARLANYYGWTDPGPDVELIDRPASPERGQLLRVLLYAGLFNLEPLNFAGLDLSYAHLYNANIYLMSTQGGMLDNADFTGSYFVQSELGGASLENTRFANCKISNSSFSEIPVERLRAPYASKKEVFSTRANGSDFNSAYVTNTSFNAAQLIASNFDGALLVKTDFSNTNLGLATFRNAILVSPLFDGATLKSTDFDGAIVFGERFLAETASKAEPDSFRPDRFRVDPISRDDLLKLPIFVQNMALEELDGIVGQAPIFRIKRVQPFDDSAPPVKTQQ